MLFSTWDQVSSSDDTTRLLTELACWHLEQVTPKQGNSYVHKVRDIIHSYLLVGDFLSLVETNLDYEQLDHFNAYHLRQALALFCKRSDLALGIDKEEVAYVKFVEAENLCKETNTVFRLWEQQGFNFPSAVEAAFFRASRKISHVLGDVPLLSDIRFRFGPGATTQVKRKTASARRKLSQMYCCSEDLAGTVGLVLEEMPGWIPFGESDQVLVTVEISDGHLHFVPKNAKTYRSVVVEPALNSMFQLGIGDHIARRLRRFGIDISDQTRNQNLARLGSQHGGLATLDLSSASDTIACGLVRHLLPPEWYDFLCTARTSTVDYRGERIKLQKFSSMGNGFTFPLETLIFWAFASSCTKDEDQHLVSVYGDDIVVPTYAVEMLRNVLNAAGFILNLDKSFTSGPFRESCGKDYLLGIDIRPVYIKDRLSCSSVFVLHNYYVRRHEYDAAALCLSWLDPAVLLWGPDCYGDGHLIGEFKRTPHKRALPSKDGWGGYTFETWSFKGRRDFKPLPGDYVYPSYSSYVRDESLPLLDNPAIGLITKNRRLADEVYGSAVTKEILQSGLAAAERVDSVFWRKDACWGVTIPGTSGYKRIKIYTFG